MKKFLLIVLLLCSYSGFSQVGNTIKESENDNEGQILHLEDSIRKRIDSIRDGIYNRITELHDEYFALTEKEYKKYIKKEEKAHNKFIKKKEKQWGKNNVKESTSKEWVDYSADGTSRSIVDFESGKITIEILHEPGTTVDTKEIENKLQELLTNKGKTKVYVSETEQATPLLDTPILEGLVNTPSGETVTEKNIDNAVKEIAQDITPEVSTIKGSDNVERQVTTLTCDLAPGENIKGAEKYKVLVQKYCEKYDIDQALVYAIIWQESRFNPAPTPPNENHHAYGLMQIIPTMAGKDCFSYLYGKPGIPTIEYLIDPERNIEMGVCYLHLLRQRHYTKVIDEDKQTLCIIASYNQGAGAVSKALRGDTNISKAISQINNMSYDELFKLLENNLPPIRIKDTCYRYHTEVIQSMKIYKTWLGFE